MDSKKETKYDPPPYTASERTATPMPTTMAQLPIIHVQPHFTIVSNHINERQQDMVTSTNVPHQPMPAPMPSPIPFSNPWSHPPGRCFPRTFSMHYRPRLGGRRDYFLATRHAEPLNEITFHSILLPSIALHPGLDKSRAVASFSHSTVLGCSRIHAAWLAGGHTDIRIRHVPRAWTFAARVGQAAGSGAAAAVVQRFEWRRTCGHAVHYHLGARKGWKLLRMNRAAQAREGAERSRDGAEVVAALAFGRDEVTDYGLRAYEAFKLLSFAFVGVGATGELGEEWEVLAAMTALGIWHRNRD